MKNWTQFKQVEIKCKGCIYVNYLSDSWFAEMCIDAALLLN